MKDAKKQRDESEFLRRYGRLNAEQKRAVDEIDGPVMVVAGPGTGKTTILTLRIAQILRETDTPPSGILALTFTEAGVKVMRAKLDEIIGSRANEVRIHTFHGFSASVIAEFDDHFPTLSRAQQITEVEAEAYVLDILCQKKFSKLRPLGEPDFYVGKIIGAIGDAKKEAWSPEIVREFARGEIERIKNDSEALSTRGATKGQLKADSLSRIEKCERTLLFADVYEEYETKKHDERKMDFDDLLYELVRALQSDELLLRLLQEKFLYILVDEHQDTNDAQNEIVRLLANFFETPNVFVVGDEKQAIYRFQGASVENFLHFQNIWKNMQVIPLSSNYRSHQSILDATFAMIERNYGDGEHTNLRVRLSSKSGAVQKPIDLVLAGNIEAGEVYLVEELKKITEREPEATVAVIVRWNRDVERVLSVCEAAGLHVSAERGADIFSHPLSNAYFNILEFLVDSTRTDLLAETLSVGLWNADNPHDFSATQLLIKKLRSGTDVDMTREIPELVRLQEEITHAGGIEYLILASDMSGVSARFSQSPLSAEVWRGIIGLARDIAERSHISDPRVLIRELLAYKKSAESKSIKVGVGDREAKMCVMTAHGSKGLEYDYVFIPYATEESWRVGSVRGSSFVFPREKDEGDKIRDERRLFYVGLTRARCHAVIVAGLADALGKELTPLRFAGELDTSHVAVKEIPAVFSLQKALSAAATQSARQGEIVEYAKNILLENGLSVTALNHFCECPSRFYYKSILKLPEPPSATSEKGIAMHKALSLVWREKSRTAKHIEEIIIHTIKSFFVESLLPKFEKDIVTEELVANAPKVATALLEYFAQSGPVLTETWVDAMFDGSVGGKRVELKLHGQLDALIETEKEVRVFDYKTREAMSVNAIKGETKDSDGNYFRQLVFYKMLVRGTSRCAEKNIEPSLIFIKPDAKGRCPIVTVPIVDEDIQRVESEIQELLRSVWSGEFLTSSCDDAQCEYCKNKGASTNTYA